ncbi:MAG: PD40 domain-containing protein [Caldilineaceae bacterium]|nr:PD40 domain-containing protein [Caldilineaceae bacterium]
MVPKLLLPVIALLLATACAPVTVPAAPANTSSPAAPTAAGRPVDQTIPAAEAARFPSPNQAWTAVIAAGGLHLEDAAQTVHDIFPPGSTIASVTWSPDSTRLLALQNNLALIEPAGSGFEVIGPLTVWSVTVENPTPVQLAELPESAESPSQLQWGKWSPDERYVTFWSGVLGASVLSDGLPLSVLDSSTGAILPLDDFSLYTPDYHAWSPDSSRLAVTLGGGREAWRDKSLAIFDVAAGTTTPVAAAAGQIPGRVAWSPDGSRIAYAANPADTSAPEPSTITFDNPGIAARRIYLLDVATGAARPLNGADSFQDAPVWNAGGSVLYYIQRVDDTLQLMVADPATGAATAVEGAAEPLPDLAGYYGLFIDWNNLLQQIPD